jgi:glutathione-regulated potassium-efflux system ancillary protein KefF
VSAAQSAAEGAQAEPADAPPRILILFAHLALHRSRINRALIEAIRGLEGMVFHDLLEAYPDFYIDVAREQALLREADLIVFQHPLYWYSTPAILKHWQDVVLTRGYAYGPGGDALHGKDFLQVVSTGGGPETYAPGAAHGRPLAAYLDTFEQMAVFCGMRWLEPLVIQGGHDLGAAEIDAHAQRYRARLTDYRVAASEGR